MIFPLFFESWIQAKNTQLGGKGDNSEGGYRGFGYAAEKRHHAESPHLRSDFVVSHLLPLLDGR